MALLNILFAIFTLLGRIDAGGSGDGGNDGPVSGGDEPAKGDGAQTGDGAQDASKDDDTPLGDAGKKALDQERAARRAAERRAREAEAEAERLRGATQTEQEKAIDDAKKTAAAEERIRWESRAIRAESKSALAAAGAGDVAVAVAAFLDENRDLKVNDQGEIDDLDATVQAFKKAHPTLFTARVPGGSADQGAKPPADKRAGSLEEAYERHYTQRPS